MDEEHVNLSCLTDALKFLSQFKWYEEKLNEDINCLIESANTEKKLEAERVRQEVVQHWSAIISHQSLDLQQDRLFQNILTAALENYILSQLHHYIFPELCVEHSEDDEKIFRLCQALKRENAPAEKLGIPHGYSVTFPAAVVELAALDSLTCPLDKLNCLRTTLDLLEAEIKGAIADTHTSMAGEPDVPHLTSDDMIPMLAAVIVQAKPLHLSANLRYMKTYQQTLAPHDPLCSSLDTFQHALNHLLTTDIEKKVEPQASPIGRGLSREISLEDLIQFTCQVEQMGKTRNSDDAARVTPLDCQLKRLAGMIEASTSDSIENLANITTNRE